MESLSAQEIHPALRAQAFLYENNCDSAINIYSTLIEKNIEKDKWLIQRGICYLQNKDYQKAIQDFSSVEKIKPGKASFYLAKTYSYLKDTAKTLYYIEKNLNSSFKKSKSNFFNEPSFYFLQQSKGWKKLWEKEWYSKYDYQEGEIRYLFSSKNWMGIINYVIEQNIDKSKYSPELNYMLGIAYNRLYNNQAAIMYLSNAIARAKKEAPFYSARGDCYMETKNYNNALMDYSSAIEFDPSNYIYYLKRIKANLCLKKYEQAYQEAKIIADLFQNCVEAKFLLAQSAYLDGKYLSSLENINKLLLINSTDTSYLHLRALDYNKTGLYSQALQDYNKLLSIDSLNTTYYFERGMLYYQHNDIKNACFDWKKSLRYGNPHASEFLWNYCND
jgi:tetratricopeptide (TPR) repeat protein